MSSEVLKFVSESKILDAMKNRRAVYISYTTPNGVSLARLVEIYALGVTKAGNKAIRAYQLTGGSNTVGFSAWKIFRLDRIQSVADAGPMTTTAPADYNESGDNALKTITYQLPRYNPDPSTLTDNDKKEIERVKTLPAPESPKIDTKFPLVGLLGKLLGKNKDKKKNKK